MGVLRGLVVIGVATRIALLAVSFGSNDMQFWVLFSQAIDEHGLWWLYEHDQLFNHPPLMGVTAASLSALADLTDVPFPVLFKLPTLAGDLIVLWLLRDIWRDHSERAAWTAMAVFACNPVSIFVTAHHGNTDPLLAMLILVAVRQHRRGAHFTAGVALAAAGNVKIIAGLLAPALLGILRDRRDVVRFLAGGLVGVVPFAIGLILGGRAFFENIFLYASIRGDWGLSAVSRLTEHHLGFGADAFDLYFSIGRFLVPLSAVAIALVSRLRRWDAGVASVMVLATFLLITPGWGAQYLVWIVPVLASVSTASSMRYALTAGAFVTTLYVSIMPAELPLRTVHQEPALTSISLVGIAAWLMIGQLVVSGLQPALVGLRARTHARGTEPPAAIAPPIPTSPSNRRGLRVRRPASPIRTTDCLGRGSTAHVE